MKNKSIYRVLWACSVFLTSIAVVIGIDLLGPFEDKRWFFVLQILTIVTVQAIEGLITWVKRRPDGARKLSCPRKGSGWRFLMWQLVLCLFFWSELREWSLTNNGNPVLAAAANV